MIVLEAEAQDSNFKQGFEDGYQLLQKLGGKVELRLLNNGEGFRLTATGFAFGPNNVTYIRKNDGSWVYITGKLPTQ